MMNAQDLGFDLHDLIGSDLVEEVEIEDVDALQAVAQRISGQYGELIASWTAQVLSSARAAECDLMRATVDSLVRLAHSSRNDAQHALLVELLDILTELEGTVPRTRRGDSARVALRDWVPRFARSLTGEDAARLLALVEWDADAVPLLEELRGVRGVGKRRLIRLVSAGLGNLDTVGRAAPEDVVAVTGIPLAVAEEVVARARTFGDEERRRCIEDIETRARRLRVLMGRSRRTPADDDLFASARSALQQVEDAFRHILDASGER